MVKSMYVILSTESVDYRVINLSASTSVEDLRKSADGSKCIVRVPIPIPEFFLDKELFYHSEILEELKKEEWTETE